MNNKTKKWLISSAVTFVTGFIIVIAPMLNDLDLNSLGWATFSGILFAGIRGGVKYLAEFLVSEK